MNWLLQAITDSRTKMASSKRIIALMAGASMASAVVILAVAAVYGREVAAALSAVCFPLAGLAGYTYVQGKKVERTGNGNNSELG